MVPGRSARVAEVEPGAGRASAFFVASYLPNQFGLSGKRYAVSDGDPSRARGHISGRNSSVESSYQLQTEPAKEVHAKMSVTTMRFLGYQKVLLAVVMVCGSARAQTDRVPKEGDLAPSFSITTDQGKRISPGAFGGSLLILNFWETSCVPCVKEMPSLGDFARRFRTEHVVVVAVGGDEDAQKYRRFWHDHRIALETYRDRDRVISKSFGTYMFPETYIIQDGRIIRKVVGALDWMSNDITAFIRTRLPIVQR